MNTIRHRKNSKSLIKNCLYCGNEFKTYPSQNFEYCSKQCYINNHWGIRICSVCGVEFKVKCGVNKVFCSRKCMATHYSITRTGQKLSEEHIQHLIESHKGKKLSTKHRKALSLAQKKCVDNRGRFKKGFIPWNKKSIEIRICVICGNNFEIDRAKAVNINKKTCSKDCKNKLISINNVGKQTGRVPWNKGKSGEYKLPQNSKYMKEYWQDEDNVAVMTKNRIAGEQKQYNRAERKLDKFLQKNFPNEWKYNFGDVIIVGKVPDFININGHKAFIELSGCYFHGCLEHFPDRTDKNNFSQKEKVYNELGYVVLEIWEHELKDLETLKLKIISFVEQK